MAISCLTVDPGAKKRCLNVHEALCGRRVDGAVGVAGGGNDEEMISYRNIDCWMFIASSNN